MIGKLKKVLTSSVHRSYARKRDRLLLEMDLAKLKVMATRSGLAEWICKDERVFLMSIHQARTAAVSLPVEVRQESKKWLEERGYKSLDFGTL